MVRKKAGGGKKVKVCKKKFDVKIKDERNKDERAMRKD